MGSGILYDVCKALISTCLVEKLISSVDWERVFLGYCSCYSIKHLLLSQPLCPPAWTDEPKASLSGSVIDTVTKTRNLRTVPVECHGDDTPLIFHDTPFSSLLILLVHVSKFNVHDTPITLPLRLTLLSNLCNLLYKQSFLEPGLFVLTLVNVCFTDAVKCVIRSLNLRQVCKGTWMQWRAASMLQIRQNSRSACGWHGHSLTSSSLSCLLASVVFFSDMIQVSEHGSGRCMFWLLSLSHYAVLVFLKLKYSERAK